MPPLMKSYKIIDIAMEITMVKAVHTCSASKKQIQNLQNV